jgi:hypothetical protein
MQHVTAAQNTLHVKVTPVRGNFSTQVRHFRVSCGWTSEFRGRATESMSTIPGSATLLDLQKAIDSLRQLTNAAECELHVSNSVQKMLERNS